MPSLHAVTTRGGRSATEATTVVVVEDHHAIRTALLMLLETCPDIEVLGEAPSVASARALVDRQAPDVVLLDRRLNGEDGLDVARHVRDHHATTAVLVLSASDGVSDLRDALEAGAHGFLSKSVPSAALIDGVRRVAAGQTVIAEEIAYNLGRRAPTPAR